MAMEVTCRCLSADSAQRRMIRSACDCSGVVIELAEHVVVGSLDGDDDFGCAGGAVSVEF